MVLVEQITWTTYTKWTILRKIEEEATHPEWHQKIYLQSIIQGHVRVYLYWKTREQNDGNINTVNIMLAMSSEFCFLTLKDVKITPPSPTNPHSVGASRTLGPPSPSYIHIFLHWLSKKTNYWFEKFRLIYILRRKKKDMLRLPTFSIISLYYLFLIVAMPDNIF